jgi:uncharacterized OB-fold protein
MSAYAKPLPHPDLDSAPFWEACRKHELRAQRCTGCGRFRWPPQGACPGCHAWNDEWARLPGTGVIESFVVPHYVVVRAFAADAPYIVAHVILDGTDGRVVLVSNVVNVDWREVRVGMKVEAVFDDVTPECTLPKFRPAT